MSTDSMAKKILEKMKLQKGFTTSELGYKGLGNTKKGSSFGLPRSSQGTALAIGRHLNVLKEQNLIIKRYDERMVMKPTMKREYLAWDSHAISFRFNIEKKLEQLEIDIKSNN